MSLEPAIALMAGLLVLGQIPNLASAIGVIFVVIAGIDAIRTGASAPAQHDHHVDTPRLPAAPGQPAVPFRRKSSVDHASSLPIQGRRAGAAAARAAVGPGRENGQRGCVPDLLSRGPLLGVWIGRAVVARLDAPDRLRPGQLGIVVVGHVILGHVGATIADLAQRGFIRLDEVSGAERSQWLVTDLRGEAADSAGRLRSEWTLCEGLFSSQSAVQLSDHGQQLIPVLTLVRA